MPKATNAAVQEHKTESMLPCMDGVIRQLREMPEFASGERTVLLNNL